MRLIVIILLYFCTALLEESNYLLNYDLALIGLYVSMKKVPVGIQENLQFLSVEVDSQLATLERYLQSPSAALARRIRDRAGYAYNLKTRIHTITVNSLVKKNKKDVEKFNLRCIEFVATDLERMTEICRNCLSQTELLEEPEYLLDKPIISIIKKVRRAIKMIVPALTERDADVAIKMEQINQQLRTAHARLMKRYIEELKQHAHITQLTQAMFVAYELKQFDETLVHISEAILSSNLGQPVNFERYYSLQSLIADVGSEGDVSITPIAETRSGSAIAGLSKPSEDSYMAIYKDGLKQKLKEEKQGLNSWEEIYPGLAPKILSYKKKGESAALLIEHLTGYTFEQIVVNEGPPLLEQALKKLNKTLVSLWTETRRKKVHPAKFMTQLQRRLPDVYKIHPEFEHMEMRICGHHIPSMTSLIKQAEKLEKQYKPPFSVYIHGDFNVDNIIYDPVDKRINFIDLHRSTYLDYVQDVSIFMVSNYRLQIMDAPRRKQIMMVAIQMYEFATRFSRKQGDETFDIRLALGLARAFATSTRFILDKSLAKRMFYRARYLIELVLAVEEGKAAQFRVPVKEIFVE